jgi:hypothetical protein
MSTLHYNGRENFRFFVPQKFLTDRPMFHRIDGVGVAVPPPSVVRHMKGT